MGEMPKENIALMIREFGEKASPAYTPTLEILGNFLYASTAAGPAAEALAGNLIKQALGTLRLFAEHANTLSYGLGSDLEGHIDYRGRESIALGALIASAIGGAPAEKIGGALLILKNHVDLTMLQTWSRERNKRDEEQLHAEYAIKAEAASVHVGKIFDEAKAAGIELSLGADGGVVAKGATLPHRLRMLIEAKRKEVIAVLQARAVEVTL